MQRRSFLLSAAALPLLCAEGAMAQSASSSPSSNVKEALAGFKPYMEIGDYADDRQRVFMFFSYACPFCAQHAPALIEWGKTLPSPMQFVRVPVITTERASMNAAAAFYVVREIAAARLSEFDAMAYAAGASGLNDSTFKDILLKLRLPKEQVVQAMSKTVTRNRLMRATLLSGRYKVGATPHFGVGGKYATNANFTNGNYQVLVELLNGLVSQVLM
jgi:thiol:disulfide interchange protein DsbA